MVTSSTPTVCFVVDGANITTLSSGTCTLVASQSGNSVYSPAPNLSINLTVSLLTQNWNAYLMDMGPGSPDKVLPTLTNAGLAVTVINSTPSVCTVINGIEHAVSAGTCGVIVSAPGNISYAPYLASFTASITTGDLITLIGLYGGPLLYINQSYDLSGAASDLSGAPLKYIATPSSASVCYMYGDTRLITTGTGVCSLQVVVATAEPPGYTALTYPPVLYFQVDLPHFRILTHLSITTSVSSAVVPNAVYASIVGGTFLNGSSNAPLALTTSWMQCPIGTQFPSIVRFSSPIPSSCSPMPSGSPIWVPLASFPVGSSGALNYTSGVMALLPGNEVVAVGQGNGADLNGQGSIFDFLVWNYPTN